MKLSYTKLFLVMSIFFSLLLFGCESVTDKYKDMKYCEKDSDCTPLSCSCYNIYQKASHNAFCGIGVRGCGCVENQCVIAICNDGHKAGEIWTNEETNLTYECNAKENIIPINI